MASKVDVNKTNDFLRRRKLRLQQVLKLEVLYFSEKHLKIKQTNIEGSLTYFRLGSSQRTLQRKLDNAQK